ncbi:transcription repressor OFP14-like protein [Carex littledalei]|uniref:Transcription repressor n=1 Tax=Carex littledalei TaxID=544730 RepID=A0A833VIS7_9POAL|nr:transcription repressor OFP14-like protein [Carex littledalei]
MGRKKIKFSKSMKLYLLKQLKKVPGLNLNSLIHSRSLTCNYPKTQSIDKRNSNVNFITNHESDLTDLNRYMLEYFPSVEISDDESSLIDTSTKQSPTNTGNEEFSSSTSNSLVVPSSPTGDIREGEAGVLVMTNESSSIDTSTKQSPANTGNEEFSSSTSNSLVVPSSPTGDIREGEAGVLVMTNESSSIDTSTKQSPANTGNEEFSSSTSNSLVAPSSPTGDIREGEAGVVVVTFSIDPYKDFKRSMKTMLKADNAGKSQPSNQDNLNELLLCYLEQNNKSMHKHLLRAFNDITNEIIEHSHSHRYEQENLNGNEAAKGRERGHA